MSPVAGRPGVSRHGDGERPADCHGLHFLCPVCWIKNSGPVGTHAIHCLTPAAPADMRPLPGRWEIVGDTFDTLSLIGANSGSDSVLLTGGCRAHFHIRKGAILMV